MNTKVKSLIILYTGTGKGKTTAALGAAVRSIGQGGRVCICQFIKSNDKTGEFLFFDKFTKQVDIYVLGKGFVRPKTDKNSLEKHCQAARKGLKFLREKLVSEKYQLVIADELLDAYNMGFIDKSELIEITDILPSGTHIIITGRSAPQELLDRAHTVTQMNEIKHHYNMGILAQKGIEF